MPDGAEGWMRSINDRSFYVVMSKGHRELLDRAGWDRDSVRHYLAEHSVRTVGELRRTGFGTSPFFEHHAGDDERVALVTGADKIVPIAAGGPGGATLCFGSPLPLPHRLG